MPAIQYLTVPDVLAMHMVLIKKYGGSDGVRDMGALESALARPQSGYYKDVIESAAALLESLAMNHPFIDGNKRVAFAATDTFLRINGYTINSDSKSLHKALMKFFDTGQFKMGTLEPWLRDLVKSI